MANSTKLSKNSDTLKRLHEIVRKKAEAQSSVVGTPGADTKIEKTPESTEHINKNEVKPENNTNEFKQEPSKEEAGKVVSDSAVKSSEFAKVSAEITDLLSKALSTKAADAQASVEGTPAADTKPAGPEAKTEHIDKDKVVPQNNTNEIKQEPSKEEAGKTVSDAAVKSSAEVEKMASKIAAYNVGVNLVRDLLKQSGYTATNDKAALMKQAGSRDFELLINHAADALQKESSKKKDVAPAKTAAAVPTEPSAEEIKLAEEAGEAYFDELLKQAAVTVSAEQNTEVLAKIAALEEKVKEHEEEKKKMEKEKSEACEKEARSKEMELLATKVAEQMSSKVADIVVNRLKSEADSK